VVEDLQHVVFVGASCRQDSVRLLIRGEAVPVFGYTSLAVSGLLETGLGDLALPALLVTDEEYLPAASGGRFEAYNLADVGS
jgi:hypothetical protein